MTDNNNNGMPREQLERVLAAIDEARQAICEALHSPAYVCAICRRIFPLNNSVVADLKAHFKLEHDLVAEGEPPNMRFRRVTKTRREGDTARDWTRSDAIVAAMRKWQG